MNQETSNFYELLNVAADAQASDIRRAFHKLALEHHPDRNPGDDSAAARFRKVHEAYSVLSDPEQRKIYDLKFSGYNAHHRTIQPYVHCAVSKTEALLNEEFEVVYSFPSDGRFFRRAHSAVWALCYGPVVSQGTIHRDGETIKETRLHFTIAALADGRLKIPQARIFFDHKPFLSDDHEVLIRSTNCLFCPTEMASLDPLKVHLYREQITSNSAFRKTVIQERLILLPRSAMAAWYHRIARLMKTLYPILGCAWALVTGHSVMNALIASMIFAGLNCTIMYKLMKMDAMRKWRYRHPKVVAAIKEGFQPGKSSAILGVYWERVREWIG
jgi:hypothetical protein